MMPNQCSCREKSGLLWRLGGSTYYVLHFLDTNGGICLTPMHTHALHCNTCMCTARLLHVVQENEEAPLCIPLQPSGGGMTQQSPATEVTPVSTLAITAMAYASHPCIVLHRFLLYGTYTAGFRVYALPDWR
jgi:hypothetical protein